jgi:hypothetical protein
LLFIRFFKNIDYRNTFPIGKTSLSASVLLGALHPHRTVRVSPALLALATAQPTNQLRVAALKVLGAHLDFALVVDAFQTLIEIIIITKCSNCSLL